ncbi:hypothetical protein GRJ2_000685200 [Grus japonensis]|uniref:Uncharacterized protein n=1 Tax=Grus japonensis TaxID=30415 RepID=A0ABC9WBL7_GRUJA
MYKAIRKRDDLLRKSEADFLQAREGIKAKVAEVEHLDSVVKKLKATQELASQDEKLLLMESSLKATQEQLSEQIAETVRQEQNSRKSQTELKTLRERIITSEEEISDYKVTVWERISKEKRPREGGLQNQHYERIVADHINVQSEDPDVLYRDSKDENICCMAAYAYTKEFT